MQMVCDFWQMRLTIDSVDNKGNGFSYAFIV